MATLILLAGGRSTRYGRPKQLEPVGAGGEALLDLTLQDAFDAGCTAAVIVVRPEHETLFTERFAKEARVRLVVQSKALGTAHAVMLGSELVDDTVIIANGDDHYGRDAVRQAVHHALNGDPRQHALVAFELTNTLSPSGGVNRAICTVGPQDLLRSTMEVTGLQAGLGGIITDQSGRTWPTDTLVSMNLWVLRPAILPLFHVLFTEHTIDQGEFGLPTVVATAIARQHGFVVLRSTAQWCGLTYPADTDLVRHKLAARS